MAYSDFNLNTIKRDFGATLQTQGDLFAHVEPVPVSGWLRETLLRCVPLALGISTEKARSEFIIAPMLSEVRAQTQERVSLFSGVEFNVDIERGLRGVCDFLFSKSPLQLVIEAPVIAVVEAKNDNLKSGLAQCMAEMVASEIFNREQGNAISCVYGVITTGSLWKFLRLDDMTVTADETEYHLKEVERIVGTLLSMVEDGFPVNQFVT